MRPNLRSIIFFILLTLSIIALLTMRAPENYVAHHDILRSKSPPRAGQSIFFLETADTPECKFFNFCFKNLTISLSYSQACAIESAARHNPDTEIFVLFLKQGNFAYKQLPNLLKTLLIYNNVRLHSFDPWTLTKDTPVEEWFQKGLIYKSPFKLTHLSDLLRFVILWRWGGTYLDLDMISLRSLQNLQHNYVGAQSWGKLNAAVLNLAREGNGRRIATACMEDFQSNYLPNFWSHNGPDLLTRVLKEWCNVSEVNDMIRNPKCLGMEVFPPIAFYPVPFQDWSFYFSVKRRKAVMKLLKKSFTAHIWNSLSSNAQTRVGVKNAYTSIAKKHCPKIYRHMINA